MPNLRLAGLRLLIAEDETTIAMLIEDVLRDEGCEVVGPFSRLPELIEAAASEKFDGALLDLNLHGQRSFCVAETLTTRQAPFILLTGYDAAVVPSDHSEWVICSKPFSPETLIGMIEQHILPHAQSAR